MEVKPGTYNWTQAPDDHEQGVVGRMLRTAAIYFTDDLFEVLDDAAADGTELDLAAEVSESDRALLAELAGRSPAPPRLIDVEIGRGAGAIGVAVEVAEQLALWGGAVLSMVEAARGVRWTYRRIGQARGKLPMVSLGAAEYLALADLADRGAPDEDLRVFGSGDMRSESPDRSFTGDDAFFVVLRSSDSLHHYHVSAYGEIYFIGTSPLVPQWAPPPPWADGDQP